MVGALGEEGGHRVLPLEDEVDISLGNWAGPSCARPLHLDGAKVLEGVDETLLCDVPGDATQEYLGAVDLVLALPGRELPRPGAGRSEQTGGIAVELGGSAEAGGVPRGQLSVGVVTVREERGRPHLSSGVAGAPAVEGVEDVMGGRSDKV